MNENDALHALKALITGGSIRSTHKGRLDKGKTEPAWWATPRGRRSFAAVMLLIKICTTERVQELLRRRWITLSQLAMFVKRTPLSEGHRATLERVIRLERARLEKHTGTGMTGELTRIAAGEGGSHELRTTVGDGVVRYRRGQRVRTPA